MNILIRADSSSTIGTGHIMRDLVLAKQYPEANIKFATQNLEGNINHKIDESGYKLEILKSNSLDDLDELIKKLYIDMIVIDHYGIDYNFEEQLKIKNPTLKIMVLDDTYEKHYCNILLNHNIYGDETKYKKLVPQDCELRCGINFTLLREEFVEAKKKNDILKEDIFIGMGGADSANLSQKILQVLISLTNQKINVITTSANPNIDTLKAFVSQYSNTELHINSNQVAYLMNKSSLAIVTPSVILNELFYLDTPFIAIQTTHNQKYMTEFLKKNNFDILDNWEASKFQSLIQEKIKGTILINFIDLSDDEKKMVLEWRNHPNIKKWMYSQDNISLENHLKFIESLYNNKNKLYFIVKQHEDYIGVADFYNFKDESCDIGLYQNPNTKGKGQDIMNEICKYAFSILNLRSIFAEVIITNVRAYNLYNKFGFNRVEESEVNGNKIYRMELKNENR